MSYTNEASKTYAEMAHDQLYAAAVAAGMSFELRAVTLRLTAGDRVEHMLEIGSGVLGADPDRTTRVCAIEAEMRTRWAPFIAFVKAKLLAA